MKFATGCVNANTNANSESSSTRGTGCMNGMRRRIGEFQKKSFPPKTSQWLGRIDGTR